MVFLWGHHVNNLLFSFSNFHLGATIYYLQTVFLQSQELKLENTGKYLNLRSTFPGILLPYNHYLIKFYFIMDREY